MTSYPLETSIIALAWQVVGLATTADLFNATSSCLKETHYVHSQPPELHWQTGQSIILWEAQDVLDTYTEKLLDTESRDALTSMCSLHKLI